MPGTAYPWGSGQEGRMRKLNYNLCEQLMGLLGTETSGVSTQLQIFPRI